MRRPLPLVLVIVAAVALPACGGESDESQVRDTLERFGDATARKDYQQLCDELLSPQLVEEVRSVNLPCEVALKTGFEDVQRPRLAIQRIRVDGDTATATVRTSAANQPPSEDEVRLVKVDDGWRIASLASPEG